MRRLLSGASSAARAVGTAAGIVEEEAGGDWLDALLDGGAAAAVAVRWAGSEEKEAEAAEGSQPEPEAFVVHQFELGLEARTFIAREDALRAQHDGLGPPRNPAPVSGQAEPRTSRPALLRSA